MERSTLGVRRVHLLVHQAAASVVSGDLRQSCSYLSEAAESTRKLNIRLYYNHALEIYQGMPTAWSHERPVKELADVFQPW